MKIIIQAGGLGTRLEKFTINKPKCLVPTNNLPMIFYNFQKFRDAEFIIITDYKSDVLERYLNTFATEYNFKIFKATKKGTCSGLKEILSDFSDTEPFMIVWSDLILSEKFQIPDLNNNYIGISKDFECRWSYINKKFIKEPSKEYGVAGLFVFKNKKYLDNINEEGGFVSWLKDQNIEFKELNLYGTREIGTLEAYQCNNTSKYKCRPFNRITIQDELFIKEPVNELGQKIAQKEIEWYKHIQTANYNNIPKIYNFTPLTMQLINSPNIHENKTLSFDEKKDILNKIINALNDLHNLEQEKSATISDAKQTYFDKTFERLNIIENLVPFAKNEYIKINGKTYKNIFFIKDELEELLNKYYPKNFKLIHGDCTFSNLIYDNDTKKIILIDPRGYFGNTQFYGDVDYDWAKLYYSLNGNYDQFNIKNFSLEIKKDEVSLDIETNGWDELEEYFFSLLPNIDKSKIKFLHALIWLSLTTYVWDDYDSICGAFYNGIIKLNEVI